MRDENERRWTFPLEMLFQQTMLVAVALACFRLLPDDEALRHSLDLGAYWRLTFLLSCIGTALGAAIGRLYAKAPRGALIGLGLSLPAASAWTLFVFYQYAMAT